MTKIKTLLLFFIISHIVWLVFWKPDYAGGTGAVIPLRDFLTLNPDVQEDARFKALRAMVIGAMIVWILKPSAGRVDTPAAPDARFFPDIPC